MTVVALTTSTSSLPFDYRNGRWERICSHCNGSVLHSTACTGGDGVCCERRCRCSRWSYDPSVQLFVSVSL